MGEEWRDFRQTWSGMPFVLSSPSSSHGAMILLRGGGEGGGEGTWVACAAPEEEVVGIGWKTAVLEEAQQVVELPMDIANELQRRLQLEEGRLIAKVQDGLVDEEVDVVRGERHVGAGFLCARDRPSTRPRQRRGRAGLCIVCVPRENSCWGREEERQGPGRQPSRGKGTRLAVDEGGWNRGRGRGTHCPRRRASC